MFAALFGMVFFMAQFLQTDLGFGPLSAGLRLLPGWGTLFLVAPVAGAIVRRTGERPLIAGGLALFAAGLGWTALIARTGLPYPDLVAPLAIAGLGISMAIPATQSSVMSSIPPAAIGQASGTFSTLRQLGGCSESRPAQRCSPPTAVTPPRPRSPPGSVRRSAYARGCRSPARSPACAPQAAASPGAACPVCGGSRNRA
jgi:hypothetical protein